MTHELYQNRVLLNRYGLAEEDWANAEKIVYSSSRTTLFASHRPLMNLVKRVWEPLLDLANNQALLRLLGTYLVKRALAKLTKREWLCDFGIVTLVS